MRLTFHCLAAGTLLAASAWAKDPLPEDRGAAGLHQALKRVATTARVLSVTAHPDDEDAGTLTMLARGKGADLTMLILNRGESGANLVSGDFFEGLGALRTGEMLKAAEYYGAKVRFTRFVDYGFSKTMDETFRNWKRDEVLQDCVRVVRQVKPHLIVSRFQGTLRDGHGNHQAAGLMAQLMFDAAADASYHPELGAPWQVQKLYLGGWRENEAWTLAADSGLYDPVLGRSYAQIGRDGYRWHRSQGMALSMARPGPAVTYYKLAKSRVGTPDKEKDFFERLDLKPVAAIADPVATAMKGWPTDCAPHLAQALRAARVLPNSVDAQLKEPQLVEALRLALGLEVEALVEPENPPTGPMAAFRAVETVSVVTPGQQLKVSVTLHQRGSEPVEEIHYGVRAEGWAFSAEGTNTGRFSLTVAQEAKPTQAYWRRNSVRDSVYQILDMEQFSQPLPTAPAMGAVTFKYRGLECLIAAPFEASVMDPVAGQSRRSLVVGPPVSVKFGSEAGVLPLGRREYKVSVNVRNNAFGQTKGAVKLSVPAGWTVQPASIPFAFEKEREEANATFTVVPPAGQAVGEQTVTAVATVADRDYRAGFVPIGQPGTETVYLAPPAVHRVASVDVKVAQRLRVGYVMGTGDSVPQGLEQLGVPYDLLDATAIASGDLKKYSTVMLGIRAYAARRELKAYNQRLLDYVAQGGVLVVQYNTQEFDGNYGPYPYSMTMRAEEISEEDAPVEILDPADPVFQTPNKITAADFQGWVEQRGSKFMSIWDPRYKPLVASNDTGQSPQRGGWLVAKHGKGLYIYCAYAWYRQIPYAVPGAARIFANLVSLGSSDAAWRGR
ncbi:MAG: PIG-L family deacetylase [Acidobacteria bacterium]|nr:PIG-L family deacetylase [Acidobacteriota bacterium]